VLEDASYTNIIRSPHRSACTRYEFEDEIRMVIFHSISELRDDFLSSKSTMVGVDRWVDEYSGFDTYRCQVMRGVFVQEGKRVACEANIVDAKVLKPIAENTK
jgi:hypothetical protein